MCKNTDMTFQRFTAQQFMDVQIDKKLFGTRRRSFHHLLSPPSPDFWPSLLSPPYRSRWTLSGFAWCGCLRERPPAALRPPAPARPSTRFACVPTAGCSCRKPALAPPARSATTFASRAAVHTWGRDEVEVPSLPSTHALPSALMDSGHGWTDWSSLSSDTVALSGTLGLKLRTFQHLLRKQVFSPLILYFSECNVFGGTKQSLIGFGAKPFITLQVCTTFYFWFLV